MNSSSVPPIINETFSLTLSLQIQTRDKCSPARTNRKHLSSLSYVTHLKWRPDVKGNLLLHDEVQQTSLLFVLDSATWGLDFLLQLAAPLPSIWEMQICIQVFNASTQDKVRQQQRPNTWVKDVKAYSMFKLKHIVKIQTIKTGTSSMRPKPNRTTMPVVFSLYHSIRFYQFTLKGSSFY